MGLLEDLRQLADQFKRRLPNIKGEEATKQALILPFLQLLGYDIYDPSVVQPEYVADFAKKKGSGQLEKVDYALHMNGQPIAFVEAKPAEAPLDNHDPQLARYFNATPSVKLAIITDGIRYRFFTDLAQPNVMDSSPFFVFNALSFSERDVENLARFTYGSFNAEAVQNHAQELIFLEKVTGLVGDILRNPPESFIRLLLDELQLVPGRVTQKVIDRFTPIVRKAIHTTILEMMTKGLAQEMTTAPVLASAPAQTQASASPTPAAPAVRPMTQPELTPEPPSAEGARVETTAEELEIFDVVKKVCSESPLGLPIAYKDTVSYFGINLGKVTRWFLRVYTNGPKKFVLIRTSPDQAKGLLPNVPVEPSSDGRARVYFQSVADLPPLKPLLLLAYEQEAKRKDGDAAEADA